MAVTGLVGVLPREDAGLSLIPIVTDGALLRVLQDPRVYALNARYAWGAIQADVCEGSTVRADALAWPVASSMKSFQISPGAHEFYLAISQGDCVGFDVDGLSSGPLDAGEQYLAVFGVDADGDDQLVVAKEEFSANLAPNAAIWSINAAARSFFSLGVANPDDSVAIRIQFADGEVYGELSEPPAVSLWGVTIDQIGPVFDTLGTVTLPISRNEKLWFVMAGIVTTINPASSASLRLRIVSVGPYPEPWTVGDFAFAPI